MGIRVVFIALAPTAPPCFSTREQWLSYLEGAHAEHRMGHGSAPLIASEPPRFNYAMSYCADCTQQHSLKMDRAGKCDPEHLQRLANTEQTAA